MTLDDVMAKHYLIHDGSWEDAEKDLRAAIEAYAAEQVAAEREACEDACTAEEIAGNSEQWSLGALACWTRIRARAQEQQT